MIHRLALIFAAVVVLPALMPGRACAQLQWTNDKLDANVALSDKVYHASFEAVNTGQDAIAITQLTPSCGCMTAKASDTSLKPGDHVTVTMDIPLGNITGSLTRTIAVAANDPAGPNHVLTVTLHVPDVLTLSENEIVWHEEQTSPRTMKVSIAPGVSGKIVKLRTAWDGLDAKLTLDPGAAAGTVVVQPIKDPSVHLTAFYLDAVLKDGTEKQTIVMVRRQ